MPYTEKQHRMFEAAAHDAEFAQRMGIPQDKAKQMASEGVKKKNKPAKLAQALMTGKM